MISRLLFLLLASACSLACQSPHAPTPGALLDEPSGLEEVTIQAKGLE